MFQIKISGRGRDSTHLLRVDDQLKLLFGFENFSDLTRRAFQKKNKITKLIVSILLKLFENLTVEIYS